MSKFIETFGSSKVFLPVIHAEDEKQVLANAEIISSEGCQGAFLIGTRKIPNETILQYHSTAKREFPHLWLGVNLLGFRTKNVFKLLNNNVDGVWVDNAEIDERVAAQVDAENADKARKRSGWDGLYFGGVAFKGERHVDDPSKAAMVAGKYMDVVTTSGIRTGVPPELDKIRRMKLALGNIPLAIASGISSENVEDYKNIADCFLVASSILIPNTENFDPRKVRTFVENLKLQSHQE